MQREAYCGSLVKSAGVREYECGTIEKVERLHASDKTCDALPSVHGDHDAGNAEQ